MTLRDLGYRPYEGIRLPPSSSTWVMFRYGLRRAFDSTALKLLYATSLFLMLAVTAFASLAVRIGGAESFEFKDVVGVVLGLQTWFFVGTSALLAGSTAITEDLQNKAFPFFFAKPLTPIQYLAGRILAVASVLIVPILVPSVFVVLGFSAAAPREIQIESIALVLPAILQSILVALVCSSVSVGISASSKNRAITMSLWLVLWIVPKIVAAIVKAASDQPWLELTSIPAMLGVVSDALLRRTSEGNLETPYALAGLAVVTTAALVFATNRLERAEVVA